MVERGCTAVAMEVSSHALALGRVDGVVLRRRGVHQPQPGPPRLPPRPRGLLRREGARCSRRRYAAPRVVDVDDELRPASSSRARACRRVTCSAHGAGPTRGRGLAGRRRPRRRDGLDLRAARSRRASGSTVRRAACPGRSTWPTRCARSPRWSPAGVPLADAARGIAALAGVPGRMERVDVGPAVPRARRLRAHAGRGRRRCWTRLRALAGAAG